MSEFDVLSPAVQAQIVQQYGSLAAARAAMEAPAPPPVGAPVAPPPPPVVPPVAPVLPHGAPGDPGFAERMLGTAPAAAPMAHAPVGPAPGDKDFGLAQLANLPTTTAQAAPPTGKPSPSAIPAGAGQIDLSGVTPKGFSSGAISIPNLPAGAGQVDTSDARPAIGNKYSKGAADNSPAPASPGINWGGVAGGGGVVPAHEQKLTTKAREDELLGAIDKEAGAIEGQKTAVAGSAEANAEIERQRAIGVQDIAKATEDAGVDTKLRAQQHADESKAYRQRIDGFAAKLATDKIDPNGMWNNASTGQHITWTLAKAFGAIGQAFLHTPTNQIADHIEAMAAQDVAAQRANHEIGRERLSDMKSMYGEALRETGSAEEAERVATGYALEAAKQQAQALTLNATSKAQKAKGEEVVAQLSERQALIGEKKAETGIKLNPMVQAQRAGGAVDIKQIGKMADEYIRSQATLGHVVTPDEGFRYAIKMQTGRDPMPGAGAFAGGAKAEPGGKEEKLKEARTTVEGGIGTIDRALESGEPYKQGPIGAVAAHLPFADQSKIDALARDKYNAQVKALVGAAWRMTTDGVEPKNPNLIEEQARHFEISPNESADVSRARMLALQQALRDAGTGKGVISEASQSGKVVAPTFQK